MNESFVIDVGLNESIDEEVVQRKPTDTAEIIFTVSDGGTMIECNWDAEKDEDVAVAFGALLAEICAGRYSMDILSVLKDHLENNPDSKPFISEVIASWHTANEMLAGQVEGLDETLVQPLRTFGATRIFKEQ